MSDQVAGDEIEFDVDTGFVKGIEVESAAPQPDAPQAADGNLEKVRELLFGDQSQRLEQRFAHVEQLTTATSERIDRLEGYLKNELTGLVEKLGKQREERTATFQEIRSEIEATSTGLGEQIEQLDQKLVHTEDQIREGLLQQVTALIGEVEQSCQDLSQELTTETAILRGELLDRATLSSMLTELAARVTEPGTTELEEVDATVADLEL